MTHILQKAFFRHTLERVWKIIPTNCDAHLAESIFQTYSGKIILLKVREDNIKKWNKKMLRLFLTSREQKKKIKNAQAFSNQPWAKKKIKNAQSRNRTSDTRIFSPLLYQLSYLGIHHISYCQCKLRGQDLNLRPSGYEPDELPDCSTPRYTICSLSTNGWRWIRTTEAICSRFTVCPLWPLGNPSIWCCHHKPINGLEPLTCWLQISCSANWATSA